MKKLSRSRHFKSFVALIAGGALLVTAAAGYISSGGYSEYKESLKSLLNADGYSLTLEMNMSIPGVEPISESYIEQYDADGEVLYYESASGGGENWTLRNDSNPDAKYKTVSSYSRHTTAGEEQVWNIDRSNYIGSGFLISLQEQFGDSETQQNRLTRFVEAVADLLVGDLKNNFVSTGTDENGYHGYRISLTDEQLPEIVRAGMDFALGTFDYEHTRNRTIWAGSAGSAELTNEEFDELNARIDALREETGFPIVVVTGDFELVGFEDFDEYYSSEYYLPVASDLAASIDGSLRVALAECYFALDDDGNLRYNRFSCDLEYRDVKGDTQTITAEVVINIDDAPEGGIAAPVIPEEATVYDYSQGTSENGYAYTVTKNGVVVWSNDSENAAIARAYIEGLGAEERLDYLFSEIFGYSDIDPATVAESVTLMHASGELEYYGEGFGLSADELYALLSDDLMEVYGVEVVADNLTPASVDTEATE